MNLCKRAVSIMAATLLALLACARAMSQETTDAVSGKRVETASSHATLQFKETAHAHAMAPAAPPARKPVHRPKRLPQKPTPPADRKFGLLDKSMIKKGAIDFARSAKEHAESAAEPQAKKLVPPPRRPDREAGAPQPSAEAEPMTAPTSPGPDVSFQALNDNDAAIPPDTNGAVGADQLVAAHNTEVRIQKRDGSQINRLPLDTFWKSVSTPPPSTFDPKILYDPYAKRWIMAAGADPEKATSGVLVGVSQTDDPTGTWNLFRVDVDSQHQNWFDYPSLGFNKNWIVVTGNLFSVSANNYAGMQVYAFDKADLYSNGTGRHTLFTLAPDKGFTLAPAMTYDANLDTLYLVEEFNGNFQGKGLLQIYTLTGAVGSEQLSAVTTMPSSASPWDSEGQSGAEGFAPQKDSDKRIETGDSRMLKVIFRNGSLYSTQTVFLPAGGSPTRSAVQWWQLNPNGAVMQQGLIDDAAGKVFRAFPSLDVNKDNQMLIGYSRFAKAQFASSAYSFRLESDPINVMRAEFTYKQGVAAYFKAFSGTQNRWGDYSNTVVDPTNDMDFWTIQEYAEQPSEDSRWGTFWAKVKPPE